MGVAHMGVAELDEANMSVHRWPAKNVEAAAWMVKICHPHLCHPHLAPSEAPGLQRRRGKPWPPGGGEACHGGRGSVYYMGNVYHDLSSSITILMIIAMIKITIVMIKP